MPVAAPARDQLLQHDLPHPRVGWQAAAGGRTPGLDCQKARDNAIPSADIGRDRGCDRRELDWPRFAIAAGLHPADDLRRDDDRMIMEAGGLVENIEQHLAGIGRSVACGQGGDAVQPVGNRASQRIGRRHRASPWLARYARAGAPPRQDLEQRCGSMLAIDPDRAGAVRFKPRDGPSVALRRGQGNLNPVGARRRARDPRRDEFATVVERQIPHPPLRLIQAATLRILFREFAGDVLVGERKGHGQIQYSTSRTMRNSSLVPRFLRLISPGRSRQIRRMQPLCAEGCNNHAVENFSIFASYEK